MMRETPLPNPEINLSILLAEDDPDDVYLFEQALVKVDESIGLRHFCDGTEAFDHLRDLLIHNQKLPTIIFLDLNMPKQNGKTLLRQIKTLPGLRHVPVVVLSTSENEADISDCYSFGANSYIVKPNSFEEMITTLQKIKHYWFETVQLSEK